MRLVALFAVLIIALVTSCTTTQEQKTTLPQGTALLADSAKAMRAVTTTHFAVNIQGNAPTVQLRSADGRLTREGSAQGT
ncbi:MAG: LppX_LprAFG lipoprotein, partial [Pseudonocardiales bacterium]|nr:LppX_LprAFG lipoprotein [Pseudonocardiales bacterium]